MIPSTAQQRKMHPAVGNHSRVAYKRWLLKRIHPQVSKFKDLQISYGLFFSSAGSICSLSREVQPRDNHVLESIAVDGDVIAMKYSRDLEKKTMTV